MTILRLHRLCVVFCVRNVAWITGVYKVLWRKSAVAYVKILSDHLSRGTNEVRNPQSVYPLSIPTLEPGNFCMRNCKANNECQTEMWFCLKFIVSVCNFPMVLTHDPRCVLPGFVVHVLWNITTTFRCCCLPCTHHIAYHAPTLLTMLPHCLPCTHIAYHAPTLLTILPYCLPCTHIWILRLLWKPKLLYRQTIKYYLYMYVPI